MDEALQPPAASSSAGGESPATATDGLRRSYLIGLALLAALAILGQVLVQRSSNQQVGDTGVVNLAGIERGRSERLAKELLATIIIDRPDSVTPSELRLETTLTVFKQTWVGLIEGDDVLELDPITDPASRAQYDVADRAYVDFIDALERTLVAFRAGEDHTADLAETLSAQRRFFGEVNGLTDRLEEASATNLAQTRQLQFIFLAATLLALVGLGFGSFRPALRRLKRSVRLFEALSENSPEALFLTDDAGNVFHQNPAAQQLFGRNTSEGSTVTDLLGPAGAQIEEDDATNLIDLVCPEGTSVPLRIKTTTFKIDAGTNAHMYVVHDRTEELEDEKRQRQTEKLEAIGVLAAGIAHEINTPTQFVRDNLTFIDESVNGLLEVTGQVEAVVADPQPAPPDNVWSMLSDKLEEIDAEFIREELGSSIEQSMDGMNRVAEIVRAMKDFSHPGADGLAPANLNDALSTTSIICRSEWSEVADLQLDLAPDLPMAPVLLGDIKQVFLNLIVNAAHAIGDDDGREAPGKITIRTFTDASAADADADADAAAGAEHAVIEIIDNGPGVPDEIAERIFEPFFTTKEVGKGTGQGLTISQRVVVEGHGGTIELDKPDSGRGSIFRIRLPLTNAKQDDAQPTREEPALAGL